MTSTTLLIIALAFALIAGFVLGFAACAIGLIREKARLSQEREASKHDKNSKQEDKRK